MKYIRNIVCCFVAFLSLSFLFLKIEPILASETADQSTFSYIVDSAGLLSDTELQDLNKRCQTISDEKEIDILILTEEQLDVSRKQYIEDFYDFIYPTIEDAVIFLINMDSNDRGVEIQGYGSCEYSVSDDRIETIIDAIFPSLSDGEYYNAMVEFIDHADTYFNTEPNSDYQHTQEDNQAYEDAISDDETNFAKQSLINLFIALAIGAIAVFLMAYNSGGKMTANQGTYLDAGRSRVLGRYDRYIRTTTTKRPKPKPPENNSGGSSSGGGVSSGGHSHSGGGRSF